MKNNLVHAAERKAFKLVLDNFIKKAQTKDASEAAESLIDHVEKIMKGSWPDHSFETLRQIANDPDSKWARYTDRLIKNSNPNILSTFLLNAAYEMLLTKEDFADSELQRNSQKSIIAIFPGSS